MLPSIFNSCLLLLLLLLLLLIGIDTWAVGHPPPGGVTQYGGSTSLILNIKILISILIGCGDDDDHGRISDVILAIFQDF